MRATLRSIAPGSITRSIRQTGKATLLATALAFPLAFPWALSANATDLVIALKNSPPTMDPHFMTSPSVAQLTNLVFEPLISRDDDNKMQPKLAESWKVVNDTTWEFKLRRGVKFHDGTPFTAHDVVYTYARAPNVPNALSSFKTYLSQVAKAEAVDDHTLRITTHEPSPTLLDNLSTVLIVSRKIGEVSTTNDYNAGKAMIGTGPYKFVSWALNENNVFEANASYWGGKPEWDKLTYRIMTNDATRVAAILAGDIDVAETVPSQEIERLRANPNIKLWTRETSRIAYYALDIHDDALTTGRITGPNGEKLDKNPLADQRVREAMKLSIDLDSFISKIYQGEAVANGQFITASNASYNPDYKPWKADPEAARKLMQDSGWAGKFKLDLVVSSTVFQNSVPVAEGVAQAWTRIGLPTKVTQLPYPAYADQRVKRAFPVAMHSFQNQSGSAEFLMPTLLHTRVGNYGSLNFTRYSNKEFDKLVEDAVSTMDDDKRAKMLQQAVAIALKDATTVPLWLLSDTTATKKHLTYKPRIDRYMTPGNIKTVTN